MQQTVLHGPALEKVNPFLLVVAEACSLEIITGKPTAVAVLY